MSLVHRCDLCKKIIRDDANTFEFGTVYDFDSETYKKKFQVKINGQFVTIMLGLKLNCGEAGEVCRSCIEKITKKLVL